MKKIIQLYFKIFSFLWPTMAGKVAFRFFQRPLNNKIRKKELEFYKEVERFKVKYYLEDIDCFAMGSKDGKLVIMVHGWESNAASLSGIGRQLAEAGHRVVYFNLPAHGFSKLKRGNLKISKEALLEVINFLNPSEPFSIVAHSFGSAVSSYALSKTTYAVDQLVLLTSPNKIETVFQEFSDFIGLNAKAHQSMCLQATNLLHEPLRNLCVADLGEKITYNKMTIIQDEKDKVISKEKAIEIHDRWDRSELILVQKKGHYRMLWDDEVIGHALQAIDHQQIYRLKTASISAMVY